ncbi:MAG: hypothetical protein Q9225_005390 [Loekoesia sp. 1 TL-2023]
MATRTTSPGTHIRHVGFGGVTAHAALLVLVRRRRHTSGNKTRSKNSMSATDPSRYGNAIQTEQQQGEDDGSPTHVVPAPQTPLNPYRSMPSQTEQQQREQDGSSSSPVLPTYPDPETPLVPYRSVPYPSSQIPSTPPSQLISPHRLLPRPTTEISPSPSGQLPSPYHALSHPKNVVASSSPSQLPSFASLGLPRPVSSISSLAMNQMANIPLGLTREKAGINDEEASRMWALWCGLLPDGVATNISAPRPGASQQERQQAVVWLGQDVYAGLLAKAEGRFLDRLRIVKVLRGVARYLNDEDAVGKIHELLVAELGEDGPGMLA